MDKTVEVRTGKHIPDMPGDPFVSYIDMSFGPCTICHSGQTAIRLLTNLGVITMCGKCGGIESRPAIQIHIRCNRLGIAILSN